MADDFTPGELVRVSDCTPATSDAIIVEREGELWVLDHAADDGIQSKLIRDGRLWWARSLATGFEHLWFEHEMERAGKEGTQA